MCELIEKYRAVQYARRVPVSMAAQRVLLAANRMALVASTIPKALVESWNHSCDPREGF